MGDEEAPERDEELERKSSMSKISHPPETDRNPCKFPDLFFGLAWLSSVVAMVVIAFEYGWEGVGSKDYNESHKKKEALENMIKIFILGFLFAALAAQVVMHIMMRFGGFMIHVGLFVIEGMLAFIGVLCAEYSRWYLSLFFFVCALLAVLFHCMARHRIAFASATLHVACDIVLHYPMLQAIAFVGVLAAVGFFFIFALAIYGYYLWEKHKDAKERSYVLPILIFVAIFFWTQQVFRYITIATTSGTAQSWWYGRLPSLRMHPAVDALARNSTYNLGSICFGAFFVAIIETVVVFVNYLKKKAEDYPGGCCVSCCLGCVTCCLGCCAAFLDYINGFAFTYVGIHGYSYLYAGKQVVELFSAHGLTAVGNDYFAGVLFFVNSLAIGVISAIFAVWLVQFGPDSWSRGASTKEIVAGLVCGIGGYCISTIVFSLVDGANKATLVLFAENPHVLEHNHPDDFERLTKVWSLLGNELKEDEDERKD